MSFTLILPKVTFPLPCGCEKWADTYYCGACSPEPEPVEVVEDDSHLSFSEWLYQN